MLSVPRCLWCSRPGREQGGESPGETRLAEGRSQQEPWGPSGAQGWRDVTEAVSRPALSSSVFLPSLASPTPCAGLAPQPGALQGWEPGRAQG